MARREFLMINDVDNRGRLMPVKRKPTLHWVAEGKEMKCLLDRDEIRVGRRPESHVCLEGHTISDDHARIVSTEERVFLEDLGSSCGSFVNGVRLKPHRLHGLHTGDLIRLGRQVLQFIDFGSVSQPEIRLEPRLDFSMSQQRLFVEIRELKQTMDELIPRSMLGFRRADLAREQLHRRLDQLQDHVEARFREYKILQEISRKIGKILDIQQLMSTTLELLSTVLRADRGVVLLRDPYSGRLEAVANRFYDVNQPSEVTPTEMAFSGTVVAHCAESREIIMIEDALKDQRSKEAQSVMMSTIRSVLCIPLIHAKGLSGVIYLDTLRRPGCFNDGQLEFLESLALQVSTALENAALYTQAVTDDLTGLFNRKFTMARLKEELSRSERHGQPCSLVMADLDHFKEVNDRFGHLAGDRYLKEVAQVIKKQARIADVVGRFGGEEFLLLLPETDQEGALELAERIRQHVADISLEYASNGIQVTVSLGVFCYGGEPGVSVDDVLQRTDEALYEAKSRGRNRVQLSDRKSEPGD